MNPAIREKKKSMPKSRRWSACLPKQEKGGVAQKKQPAIACSAEYLKRLPPMSITELSIASIAS